MKYEKLFKGVVMDIWQNNYKILDQNNSKIRKELDNLEQERQKIFDLHRKEKYSDQEFLEQKEFIKQKIWHKQTLLQENHLEEFDMEEALDYCFSFVRKTVSTWDALEETDFTKLLQFQKQIFPEKVEFDGKKFGTSKLSLIYKLNQDNSLENSNLVDPRRFELLTSGVQNRRSTK
jgi:hypothetical protein